MPMTTTPDVQEVAVDLRVIIARTDLFRAPESDWVATVVDAVTDALGGSVLETRFRRSGGSERPLGILVAVDALGFTEGPRS